MRRSTKHQYKKVVLSPLSGGINVAQPPEQIAETEMQMCENFWYEKDSLRLVGRGGLKKIATFDEDIVSLDYDIDTNYHYAFLKNRDAWCFIAGDPVVTTWYIDKVSGSSKPRLCKFNNNMMVASGGLLQFYSGLRSDTLKSITSAPICDHLFYRFGRLAVAMAGSDRITYSSTGDAISDVAWTENTNDDSSSKWLDIGSDDSGDILEIVPLATDMIVFKTNGKAYQLVGDADWNSWCVYNVANHTDLVVDFINGISATNLGQEVVFLSLRGLKTLATTQDYGNIAATDIGSKFNKLLTNGLYEPEIFHLRRHKTLLIRPTADKSYFVAFNYGVNAATVIRFGFEVSCVLETKDDLLVASGPDLYRWTIEATQDGEFPITYKLSPKDITGADKVLVKGIDTDFNSDHAGEATFSIGDRLNITVPTNHRQKVRCNHSEEVVHIEVASNSRFELDHIVLDVADL